MEPPAVSFERVGDCSHGLIFTVNLSRPQLYRSRETPRFRSLRHISLVIVREKSSRRQKSDLSEIADQPGAGLSYLKFIADPTVKML